MIFSWGGQIAVADLIFHFECLINIFHLSSHSRWVFRTIYKRYCGGHSPQMFWEFFAVVKDRCESPSQRGRRLLKDSNRGDGEFRRAKDRISRIVYLS